jgi:hypothetical protein
MCPKLFDKHGITNVFYCATFKKMTGVWPTLRTMRVDLSGSGT